MTHLRFLRDHHKHIKKVAGRLVTDSPFGDAAEHIASHFVAAEIKHFPAGDALMLPGLDRGQIGLVRPFPWG